MDPNANVAELIGGTIPPDPSRARELGDALVGWLECGGFIPSGLSREEALRLGLGARACRTPRQVTKLRLYWADVRPVTR